MADRRVIDALMAGAQPSLARQSTRSPVVEALAAPTLEALQSMQPQPSKWDKLGSYAVNDSIPAQMVKSAWSGLTFPGDVYQGKADPYDYGRALDTAGLLTLGSAAVPSHPNELRMGANIFDRQLSSQLEDYAKSLGADISISEAGNGNLILNKIVVPKELRSQGIGSNVMQKIIDMADQNGRNISLTPSADFGGSKSRLTEFYKRFGFIPNTGKSADFSISETMKRYPKSSN